MGVLKKKTRAVQGVVDKYTAKGGAIYQNGFYMFAFFVWLFSGRERSGRQRSGGRWSLDLSLELGVKIGR